MFEQVAPVMSTFLGHYLELLEEFRPVSAAPAAPAPTQLPAVSLQREGAELVLSVKLPGLTREEITLKASTTTLYLTVPGMLSRAVPLPAAIEPEKVRAIFQDGVLRVTCPMVPRIAGDKPIDID